MAYLLTGAAGFIGYHTATRLLQRGEEVIGLDNLNPYYAVELKEARLQRLKQHPNFSFRQIDIADETALKAGLKGLPVSRIIHLAAQAGVRYSLTHPQPYGATNLVGHLNMLEYARHLPGLEGMVYASSSSVYGGNTKLPFAEDDAVDRPVSLYAATKRSAELMSHTYAHLYGMKLTALRFFTVYGPWYRPDMAMWLFAEAIMAGRPINVFNNGRMRRDFTYVDDIVEGVLRVADRPAEAPGHRIYNIGNSRSEDLMHMIGVLEKALGREAQKVFLPMQDGDVPETYADISRIRADYGFEPSTTIEAGVPKFVEWYLDWRRGQ